MIDVTVDNPAYTSNDPKECMDWLGRSFTHTELVFRSDDPGVKIYWVRAVATVIIIRGGG